VPLLSAIIPFERGNHSLVAALDGFLGQSVPASRFEVVLVRSADAPRLRKDARLRRLQIRSTAWPRGGSLAAALTAGATVARAPVVALLSPQWRPLPGLVEYCLQFHQRETALTDVLTLGCCIDARLAENPLLWWLNDQGLAGTGSLSPGIHNWRAIRFDALSAKRDLLRTRPIPTGANDDWLMKAEWVRTAPLRVFAEPVPVLTTAAAPHLGDILSREYRASFARLHAMRRSGETFADDAVDDRFQHPDKYILPAHDLKQLIATIDAMTSELSGRHPAFAVGEVAEQFAILAKLYLRAVSHARSTGWSDAKAGRRRRA
jgi:hypothetical protein